MMTTRQDLGALGEDLACSYLAEKGYRIIARNIRAAKQEIDILARLGDTTVFVEVKTRADARFGFPEEGVTTQKLKHVKSACVSYVARERIPSHRWRLDVLAIRLQDGRTPEVVHFEDVLRT